MNELLLSILLGACIGGIVMWAAAGIQAIIYNSRDEKRRAERAKREKEHSDKEFEYFEKKLKALK